jgi:hypothetical protein
MQGVLDALQANAVLVSLVVGSLAPLLISVVQQPNVSDRTRKIIATVSSVLIGFAVAASMGELTAVNDIGDVTNLLGVVGAVWAASESFFQKVWKPSGVTGAVETLTSWWLVREPKEAPGDLETK